ncbi:hypothetical protein Tco_0716728 [Tanacetum coccineum]
MSGTILPPPVPNSGNTRNPIRLLDSMGGSHVTNVPQLEVEDLSSWKDRFLVYLDGLEPYLLEILENESYVLISPASTSENILIKPKKQWSPKNRKLANQDKRLKSIIISCLLNDRMKVVIKCATAREMWNNLIIRDTKIAALRLKFNAFKALEGEKVKETYHRLEILLNELENKDVKIPHAEVNATFVNSPPKRWLGINQTPRANKVIKNDSLATLSTSKALISNTCFQESDLDVEEDTKSSSKLLANLNVEFHKRALLANQKRFYKRSGKDEGVTRVKAFMAITKDEPAVGKADAKSGQWVEITMKKVQRLLLMYDGNERKHVLDYTNIDLHYVEDQSKNLLSKFISHKQELFSCKSELIILKNTKAHNLSLQNEITRLNMDNKSLMNKVSDLKKKKETISSKEIMFTKEENSPSKTVPKVTFDTEFECYNQEPLPPLPKLSGAEPIGTSIDVIPPADLTQAYTILD